MISSGITALLFDLLKILIGNTPHEYFYVTEIFVANFAFFLYYIIFFYINQLWENKYAAAAYSFRFRNNWEGCRFVGAGASAPAFHFGKKYANRPRSKQLEKFAIWGHGWGFGSCRWLATRQYSTLPHICQY